MRSGNVSSWKGIRRRPDLKPSVAHCRFINLVLGQPCPEHFPSFKRPTNKAACRLETELEHHLHPNFEKLSRKARATASSVHRLYCTAPRCSGTTGCLTTSLKMEQTKALNALEVRHPKPFSSPPFTSERV